MGKPWAKLVVPSSGSTYQRYSEGLSWPPPSSATIAVGGEVRAQALHHQLLGGAVGFRHQVEFALQFEGDAALEVVRQQGARLARDFDGGFQVGHRTGAQDLPACT